DLGAWRGEGGGAADGAGGAVGVVVANELADEGLAGVADEDRAAEIVKPPGASHQRDVVLVGFAEADAGIEANPLAVNSCVDERVVPLAEVLVDLSHDIGVLRIVLHRLGGVAPRDATAGCLWA